MIFGADRARQRRDPAQRQAERNIRAPNGRGEGRHRPGAGGPQAAGRGARQADPRQRHHGAPVVGREPARLPPAGRRAQDRHRSRHEPAAQGVEHRRAGLEPVGRQPAEGRAGQVVSCRRRHHHPRRADARRRRRRQDRDLRHRQQARRGRQGRAGDLLRAPGAVRPVRPRPGDGRGRAARRTEARRTTAKKTCFRWR